MDNNLISIDFTRQRKCLTAYVNYDKPNNESFEGRLARIKSSIEKINRLMAELKQISETERRMEDENI